MRDPVTAEVLAAAVAATDAGVLVCDRGLPDAPVVFANDGFCRMTGYPREEVLGRNCRFLQGPGTDRDAVARLRDAIAAGRPVEAELLNYRRDGGPFWNALRIGPVADGDGPARFLVGVLHDVTLTERGKRPEHAKDAVTTVMSHAIAIHEATPVRRALLFLASAHLREAAVVDAEGVPLGVFRDVDGLRWIARARSGEIDDAWIDHG